jgi:methionyl aminopeptidase
MSIESAGDWAGLRDVGRVVRLTLDALEQQAHPGVRTSELDHLAAEVFRAHGARSAPALVYGFPGTVLLSVNDEVVHGVPGARRLESGDVLKLDVTAEKNGYMADAARTVLIGQPTNAAWRLRACVRAAFERAMLVARDGVPVSSVGRVIDHEVRARGFQVIRQLAGHGIGRTIHESPSVPNYRDPRQRDVFTEGLVVAIEPIICSGSGAVVEDHDGWTIRTTDGSLAAHYEHTVVITRHRPFLLTAA